VLAEPTGVTSEEVYPATLSQGDSGAMIYGVGIDSIETDRVKRETEKSGDKFCRMIFTEKEIEYCRNTSNLNIRAQRFACRFSAKEAFFKAIGTGLRDGLRWQDVEVSNDSLGKPYLVLRNKALDLIEKENISNIQLSLSHRKNAATAVVILER
jgi:holo-[acyl-carrier protein] synthase